MKNRRFLILAALAAIVGLLGGAAASRAFLSQPAKAQDVAQVINAKQFEILDAGGSTRVMLSTSDGAQPMISFFDQNAQYRAVYGLTEGGEPIVSMFDANGKLRSAYAMLEATGPTIELYDEEENIIWKAP